MALKFGAKKVRNLMGMFDTNFRWVLKFSTKIKEKILETSNQFEFIKDATPQQDKEQCIDFVLVTPLQGEWAVRLRRPHIKFRDFTIRTRTPWNRKTEINKLKEGWGKYYFYGWLSTGEDIKEYILVDLDQLRKSGLLLISREEKPNIEESTGKPDGTYFTWIERDELRDNKCLILEKVKETQKSKSWEKPVEQKEIISNPYFPPGEYKRLFFGKDFTLEFFNHLKSLNNPDSIACFMSKKFLKKNFEDLEHNEKYHLTVCNDLKGNEE